MNVKPKSLAVQLTELDSELQALRIDLAKECGQLKTDRRLAGDVSNLMHIVEARTVLVNEAEAVLTKAEEIREAAAKATLSKNKPEALRLTPIAHQAYRDAKRKVEGLETPSQPSTPPQPAPVPAPPKAREPIKAATAPTPDSSTEPDWAKQLADKFDEHSKKCDDQFAGFKETLEELAKGTLPEEHVEILKGFTPEGLKRALTAAQSPFNDDDLKALQEILAAYKQYEGRRKSVFDASLRAGDKIDRMTWTRTKHDH